MPPFFTLIKDLHVSVHPRGSRKDHPRSPWPLPLPQELPIGEQSRGREHRRRPSPEPPLPDPRPRLQQFSTSRRERKRRQRRRHSPEVQQRARGFDPQGSPLILFACLPLLRKLIPGRRRPGSPDSDRHKIRRKSVSASQQSFKDQEPRGRRPHRSPSPAGLHYPQPRRAHAPSRSISKMNTPELNAMYTQGMQPPGQQQVPAEQPQQFAAAPHQMPQQIPQMQQVFPGPQPNDQQHGQQIPPQQDRQFAVPQQDQQGFAQPHLQPHENPLAQHPPNMQFGGVPQMPQMGQGGAQPQPFDQQFGQQIPLQPTPQRVAVPQHVPQMQHAGFVPQPQQAQFGTPAAHGVDEGYFQQGQQQQQQLQPGMPMGVQDLALGGQAAAGGPQGAFPGDAAWGHANVSQVNPPGPGGDYGREARRQERQRAQEIREAELSQMDQQLAAMRVQEDRELQAVLALSREEDEEQLEEQFRRDTHAQTIASRQHQMQDYERRREQFRQSHGLGQGGGDYRVNMVRDLDVYVPDYERVVVTSLLDLQERFRSPVSLSGSLGFGEGSVESAGVVSQDASDFGSPALSMMREGACTLRDHTIQLEGSAPTDRDGRCGRK